MARQYKLVLIRNHTIIFTHKIIYTDYIKALEIRKQLNTTCDFGCWCLVPFTINSYLEDNNTRERVKTYTKF